MRLRPKQALTAIRDAVDWRVRKVLGDDRVDRAIIESARRWRSLMNKATYIGISGSAGKTTTRGLLLGVLSRNKRGTASRPNLNRPTEVAAAILRLRPTHAFCVAEMSEGRQGEMVRAVTLLRPSIGIVTVVGSDHWSAYGSREAIAEEISKLVTSLPPTGTAVLNDDDELVRAMAPRCIARILTYGVSPRAELRAEDITAVWPERLQMTLVHGAERVRLSTQLCGSHWVPSVLGAVGGGLAVGMSLSECAAGIASVAPFEGRMQPVTTPDGVTFIRDDFKAPLWTVDACFDFMRAARARRKIIVIGELQDVGSRKGTKYERTAALAREIADISIFVGPWASSALKARNQAAKGQLRAFSHVRDAAEYVNSIAREGDLVLLKGAIKQNHLQRIILARSGAIACWRDDCERPIFCTECPDRTKPSGVPALRRCEIASEAEPLVRTAKAFTVGADEQVIVGLGNPDTQCAGSPHNVGYELVERLAVRLGLAWETTTDAFIARGALEQRSVCLIKVRTSMNRIGAGLKRLSESLSFGPGQCILVHDDLDLPLGAVRTRLSGGAGGHRGVASILEAFQTDAFRRVKIGVGQPGTKLDRVAYVLTPFDPASRSTVDHAIAAAEARALEMLEQHRVAEAHQS